MKLGAIDIGSNAIRLQISRVLFDAQNTPHFKSLESIRFPLRLGKDSFHTGEISFRSEAKFIDLMMAFRTLIDLYETDDVYGCATSAMRDSVNGERILKRAYDKSGLHIDIISGDREAELLNFALHKETGDGHYITIDVGGGSTEVNLINKKQSYARKSFKLGSVRNMQGRENPGTWHDMKNWISDNKQTGLESAIGTGGNIRSLYKITKSDSTGLLTFDDLKSVVDLVKSKSYQERIQDLDLREDRADVISFASDIYLAAMDYAGAVDIYVPDVGLKDGIIQMLYERNI